MQRKATFFVLLVSLLVLVAGCAPVPNSPGATPAPSGQINLPAVSFQINTPGPNPLVQKSNTTGQVAGALLGLWHGLIAPVTEVLSFFYPQVQMYEVHNDGSQYNLGFLLGIAIFFAVLGALFGSRRH